MKLKILISYKSRLYYHYRTHEVRCSIAIDRMKKKNEEKKIICDNSANRTQDITMYVFIYIPCIYTTWWIYTTLCV